MTSSKLTVNSAILDYPKQFFCIMLCKKKISYTYIGLYMLISTFSNILLLYGLPVVETFLADIVLLL